MAVFQLVTPKTFMASWPLDLQSAIIRDLLTVSAETPVLDAILQMGCGKSGNMAPPMASPLTHYRQEWHSSCVLVVDGAHLTGILTAEDIVQLIAQQVDLASLVVGQVMNASIAALHESDFTQVSVALDLFQQNRINYLPVLDEQDRLVGLLTCGSLHQFSQQLQEEQALQQVILLEQLQQQLNEREQAELTIRQQAQREKFLREIGQRISYSLELQEILDTACDGMRHFLNADRVAIFEFDPDSGYDDGLFVAESVGAEYDSVLAKRVHDHSFGESFAELYFQGKYRAIDDIYDSKLCRCHVDILEKFQIRANLVIPVILKERLWGLVCIHQCAQPRYWEASEVDLTQQLAEQLAIAIQQANLYEKLQADLAFRKQAEQRLYRQACQEYLLASITDQVRASLNLDEILNATVKELHQVLASDRVWIYRLLADGTGAAIAESVLPDWPTLLNQTFPAEVFPAEIHEHYLQGRIWALSNREDQTQLEWPCLVEFLTELQVKAGLFVPIIEKDTLWGLLMAHQYSEPRGWQPWEVTLMQKTADQLAIAIQQANLFEALQLQLAEREQDQQLLTQRNQQLAISNLELVHATRLKNEFLANMSHELRTPLNAILGMTEALMEEVFGGITTQQHQLLQIVERSGQHLLEMINEILDLAKIESGVLELELAATDIADLCQSSLSLIRQIAHKKKILIKENLPTDLPKFVMDERRMRQVLINLLTNAVKFTAEGGQITLEVRLDSFDYCPDDSATTDFLPNPCLYFAVRDTGIGIPEDQINRLFQPFIQIDSALNRKYSGTGLGLALVKRIVELHGGDVAVTSEVELGSCFTVRLPCTEPNTLCLPTRNNSCTLSSPEPTTVPLILLAEDNQDNIVITESYLSTKGYRVVVAKDGEKAVALAQAQVPDLILMDIQMPGMDGLEAIQQIRRNPRLIGVPIIALTALAMKGDRERCLSVGANEYLSKPVQLRQLVAKINQLLAIQEAC